jgi:hypothetical protein
MGYVIAALVVLLIVGGFVFLLVTNATKKSNVSDAGDPGADQNSLSILGSDDETPAGDTSQHAGVVDEGAVPESRDDSPEIARPVVGGEAEGERSAH